MNTVMIASGDIFRTKYIHQLLEKKYRVITSSEEGEIVERLAQGTLDLLVLDSQLEVGESISILYRMRAARNFLPVIMLVQSIHSSPARIADELGAFRILKIPFEDQELIYWVARGIAEDARRRETAEPDGRFQLPGRDRPEHRSGTETGEGPQYYIRILEKYSDAAHSFSSLEDLLEVLVKIVRKAFDVRKVSLLLYQPKSGKFAVEESSWMDSLLTKDFLLQHEKGLAAWMSRNQRILRKEELEGGFLSPDTWEVKRDLEHLQAVAAIPLLTEGKLVGLVACGDKFTGDRFSREELSLFSILSTFFARAIRQAIRFREIARQEEIARTTLDSLPTGVVVFDGEGKIISLNRAARQSLGFREDHLISRPAETIGEEPAGLVRRSLESREPVEGLQYINPVTQQTLLLSTVLSENQDLSPLRVVLLIQETEAEGNIHRAEKRISERGR
ncbi:MAG: GAF domain-containing protein [Candidatus Erginobacter occultus]|nr:GAF domain-containing protein [Candidatus Erginobacter occultus]